MSASFPRAYPGHPVPEEVSSMNPSTAGSASLIFVLVILFLAAGPVAGHETWSVPDAGTVTIGNNVSFAVGSSHGWGMSEEVPAGYVIAVLSDPDGHREVRTAGDGSIRGLYRVFRYNIRNTGLYLFTVYHTEGSWTHIITDPKNTDPEGGLWIDKKAEDIDLTSLPDTAWSDAWYVETTYTVHCYSKTFLVSGNADYSRGVQPVHSTFEIVPLTDIRRAGTGDFAVRVLYRDAPLSGIAVSAAVQGNETTPVTAITDARGIAVLPLNRTGTWRVRADTGADPRIVSFVYLPRGSAATARTPVGPVYRYTLVLRPDYPGMS